jgi:hypothetical protein
MIMKQILPLISIILGVVGTFEGILSFSDINIKGILGKILLVPRECLFISESCSGTFFLEIFIIVSIIGLIIGVLSFKFNYGRISSTLGIILSLISLIIWLFIWFWIIGWTYA